MLRAKRAENGEGRRGSPRRLQLCLFMSIHGIFLYVVGGFQQLEREEGGEAKQTAPALLRLCHLRATALWGAVWGGVPWGSAPGGGGETLRPSAAFPARGSGGTFGGGGGGGERRGGDTAGGHRGGTAGGDLLQPSPPARGRGKAGTARGCGSRRTYLPVPSALPRCQLQLRAEPPTDYRGSSGPNPDRAGIKREPGPAPRTTAPNLRAASTRTYGEAGGEGEAHAAHGPAATGHGHRGHPAPRAGNGRAPERGGGGTNVGASRTGGEREQRDFAVSPPPEPLRASLLVLRAPLTDELLGFVHPKKAPKEDNVCSEGSRGARGCRFP